MLKKNFALSNERWERLADKFHIEFQYPPTDCYPSQIESQGVRLRFDKEVLDRIRGRPDILCKPKSFLRYVVPSILRGLMSQENQKHTIDLKRLLLEENLSKLESAQLDFVVGCVQDVLDAMQEIHATLNPEPSGAQDKTRIRRIHNATSSNDTTIRGKLNMVLDTVKAFCEKEAISTYLREYPTHVGQNLVKYQEACHELCIQALEDKASWSSCLQRLTNTLDEALHMSYALIAEICKVQGFLQQLMTLTDPTSRRPLHPLLHSLCRRAILNFSKDCRRMLETCCPEGAGVIFGNTLRTTFHSFHTDHLCKFEGVIFDTWTNQADTHDASKSLIILCDVFRNFIKRSPFDVFTTQTELHSILESIEQAFPNRFYLQVVTTIEILKKAIKVAGITAPFPTSMSGVFKCLVKKRAREAVNAGHFDVQAELRFYQQFYTQVLPTTYSSGILALRTYQVYRDLCSLLGLHFHACAERVFFEDVCETLILDPFDWVPPPLLNRQAAALLSACRDLVLRAEQTATLSPFWVQRLSGLEKKRTLKQNTRTSVLLRKDNQYIFIFNIQ